MTQNEFNEIKSMLARIEAKIDALTTSEAEFRAEVRAEFQRVGEEILHVRHVTKKAAKSIGGIP